MDGKLTLEGFILGWPFLVIVLLIQAGATECIENVLNNVPTAIQGDHGQVDQAVDKYCDITTGKFNYATKFADLTVECYKYYIWIALIIILFLQTR